MKKLFIMLMALTFVLVGCSSGATDPVSTSTIPVEELASEDDFIPMSYLVKRSQASFVATAIGGWFGECINESLWGTWQSNAWRKDDQQFWLFGSSADDAAIRITFGTTSWSPINSQWTYGKTQILKQTEQELGGSAYLLNNHGNEDPLTFSQDEEVTLEQTRSTSTDKEISVDIGVKTTASIGGDNVGAKLEQEVSATLGIKTDVATAEEESKSTTTTRHIETEVSPGRDSLVTINAPTVSSQTPFTMSAAWVPEYVRLEANPFNVRSGKNGCAADLGWPNIDNRDCDTVGNCANYHVQFKWDDFLALIGGFNTDYPNFDYQCCTVAKSNVEDPARRWVSMSGTQHRTYQNAATVTITDVTGQDLDELIKKHDIDESHQITGGN